MGGSRRPVGRFEGARRSQEGFLEDKLQHLGSERTGLLWEWGSLKLARSLRDLVAPSKPALEFPPLRLSPTSPWVDPTLGPSSSGAFSTLTWKMSALICVSSLLDPQRVYLLMGSLSISNVQPLEATVVALQLTSSQPGFLV